METTTLPDRYAPAGQSYELIARTPPVAPASVDSGRARFVLPPALAADIESVVAEPPDPRVRAVAISRMVEEIYLSAVWLHGGDTAQAELVSLAQVLEAAYAHEARIAARGLDGAA